MTWNFAYTPAIWPSLVTIAFLLILSVYSWQRRSVPGALPFTFGSVFAMLWGIGILLANSALDVATRIFWVKFAAVWPLPATTAITCFLLEYAWPGRWLTRRNLVLLSIAPLLMLLLVFTNDLHHLMWSGPPMGQLDKSIYGPALWAFILYSYAWGVVNIFILTWLFIHSPQHRWPVMMIIFAEILSRTEFLLDSEDVRAWLFIVPSFVPPFLAYAIALFAFRIFDPIPIARQRAIEQLHAGMLVVDSAGLVTTLNPSAERILRVPARYAKGRRIKELLPEYPDGQLADPDGAEFELSLGAGQAARYYILAISLLKNWREVEIGRLLLLRDVTGQKQAEAALRESEEILRLIFENATDGIAIYEEYPEIGERKILECNERYAEMSGRSREELLEVGDPAVFQTPLPPVPYAKPRSEVTAAQTEGFFSWVRPDGKENTIEYRATSIRLGGRLLTIGVDRDITERVRSQAQIVGQQRVLATFNERERLARELHDSLGQVLAFVNAQGQTVRRLLARNDLSKADEYIARLVEVAREADMDIRESIQGLRMTFSEQGFFPVLEQYLERYQKNYEIRTELVRPEALGEAILEPQVEVQLLRILQEALTNARKHAKAQQVRLEFALTQGNLQVTVLDDGVGFDSQEKDLSPGERVGLRVMRERAVEIGGNLVIWSRPGQGTRVVVSVPLHPVVPGIAKTI